MFLLNTLSNNRLLLTVNENVDADFDNEV